MNDLKLLQQLIKGQHLEPRELARAEQLIQLLQKQINNRKQA